MPHDRDPMGTDMTQGSGYTPASEMGTRQPEEAGRTATQVQEKAKEVGAMAQERLDEATTRAGEGMQHAAESVREMAQERGGVAAEVGAKAADAMEGTATYLRDADTQKMMDDIERYVRQHPVQAVAGAIVGGFILGRLLS